MVEKGLKSSKSRERDSRKNFERFRFGADSRDADVGEHRDVRVPDAVAREQDTAETGRREKA